MSIYIPEDKVHHAMAGIVAVVVALTVVPWMGWSMWFVPLAPLALGILKEAWDGLSGRGTVDPWDVVATAVPGLPTVLLAL